MVKIRIELEIEKCTQCPCYHYESGTGYAAGTCSVSEPTKKDQDEGFRHRSVMEGKFSVEGVPKWCPHLAKE